MMIAVLSLLLSASPALPSSFVPPKGWVGKTPPTGAPFDFAWVSPHFGINGNAESLSVASHPVSSGSTINDEVLGTVEELSHDRTIINSHAEHTCHGRQPAWTFDSRFPLEDGKLVSEVYHFAIVGGRAYTFIFTHLAGDRIDPAITNSIQSICPNDKPAT